jgi:D-alanine-D-alanine ligase
MVWTPTHSQPRIAVLCGGDSAERAVSLESGGCVTAALEQAGYAAERIDTAEVDLASIPWCRFDACFLALHGGAGEDGRLQRRLELLRVPYTGSGPSASRLAMSKSASKERFRQAGVPTLPYVLFPASESIERLAAPLAELRFPLIIKPDSQGSSLGVMRANHEDDLIDAIHEAGRFDDFLIAEPFVCGREFTVAVLCRTPLPLLEIVVPGGIFDYEAKYESVLTQYRFETGLDSETLEQIQRVAVEAAEALGTKGLVRVDLLLDPCGRPWVLEVNTTPGMTRHSLVPMAAARAGYDLPALCHWMVQDCLGVEALR